MFGGFFNRMYYGDPKKPDLKSEDLKKQRIKLLMLVLQIRFWKIIQLNLLYSLFWLPAFALVYLQIVVTAETGEPFSLIFFLLFTVTLLIAGPATAGVTYVLRNWARDEHAWLLSDFKDAFKQNWKESLLVMLINGIVVTLLYVNLTFYFDMAVENQLFIIVSYLTIALAVVYAMMNMYIFPMLVTYKLNIKQIYKNAFIFTVVKLPHTFGVFLVILAIFGASVYFVYPIFIVGLTFPMLLGVSQANWVFDIYMNKSEELAESELDIK